MIQISALAKHKIQLLSIHLTIVWGDETYADFLAQLETSLKLIEANPTNFPLICNSKLQICEVGKDETYIVFRQEQNEINVVTLFDYRQNPVLIYNELTEHFHEN